MNINKIQYKSRLLTLLLFALFSVVGYAADLIHQKGASGRDYTIVPMYKSKGSTEMDNVTLQATHELIQILYVKDGEVATLQIQQNQPEHQYSYLRWYRYDTHIAGDFTTIEGTYDGTTQLYYDCGIDGKIKKSYKVMVGATYTVPDNYSETYDPKHPITLACDASFNQDVVYNNNSVTEPTLSYRAIYKLRPAKLMATELDKHKSRDNCLEEYDMIAPASGNHIILGTQYPFQKGYTDSGFENQYYYTKSNGSITPVSNVRIYELNGSIETRLTESTKPKLLSTDNGKQFTIQGTTTLGKKTYIVKDNANHYIAKFVVDYQDVNNVGPLKNGIKGKSDKELGSLYREIDALRFDFANAKTPLPTNGLTMWNEPLPFDKCTYGFKYKASYYTTNGDSPVTNVDSAGISFAQYAFLSSSEQLDQHRPGEGGDWAINDIYDRLYIRTGGQEDTKAENAKHGYFMYVDAAEVQGTVAKLDISEACCPGTNIYLSTWIADAHIGDNVGNTNKNVTPNLNFEIVAIDTEGKEKIVKTYTTCNFKYGTKPYWQQVYFSFQIPIDGSNYNKLYLRVVNNQVSSRGDDFVIDDIVAYMEKPAMEAEQTQMLCGEDAEMKVHVDYEQMLKLCAMDKLEKLGEKTIGCCFVDSALYYKALIVDKKNTHDALIASLVGLTEGGNVIDPNTSLRNNYIQKFILYGGPDADKKYKKADGMTNDDIYKYSKGLDPYTGDIPYVVLKKKKNTNDKDTLDFIVKINGKDLVPGKRYYTIFNINVRDSYDDIANTDLYSIDKACDAYTSFILEGTGKVAVDGVTDLEEQNGDFCSNRRPTFHVTQMAYMENDEMKWFDVDEVPFDWYRGTLREFYEEDKGSDGHKYSIRSTLIQYRLLHEEGSEMPKSTDFENTGQYDDFMKWITPTGDNDAILVLDKKFYSPSIPKIGLYNFIARPVLSTYYNAQFDSIGLCINEQQIMYNVTDQAPELDYGLPNADYAGAPNILAIRASLKQLKEVTENNPVLVPIRRVKTYSTGSHMIGGNSDLAHGNDLCFSGTDDPALLKIPTTLPSVGKVKTIIADTAKQNNKNSKYLNYMLFYTTDNDQFNLKNSMKEGYTYDMKFFFRELEGNAGSKPTGRCSGSAILRIKVVPEYENWTGAAGSKNWCNDDNWERSDGDEIYKDTVTTAGKITYSNNVKNTTPNGFVPLNLTNITIKKGTDAKDVPYLIAHKAKANDNDILNLDAEEAGATKDIAYDMTIENEKTYATDYKVDSYYNCHLFYENTCKDIYLKPEAEIMNAQHLNYTTARVDYELEPNRWYLLSSPLKAVYAGDMYAPMGTAQQKTDAFEPITFDLSRNNRFNPAVYQRSWDKKSSLIYDKNGDERNVYIRANWSNVYNDVNVEYVPGTGFSIKVTPGKGATVDTALFRLPKEDEVYKYYTSGDNPTSYKTQSITRSEPGKLFTDYFNMDAATSKEVTITNTFADNKLMLVGNPFPCQLDMFNFLNANSSQLEGNALKYYIMTAGTMNAALFDVSGDVVSTAATSSDGATVTPMQGFFVKASGNSATFKFTPAMMTGQYSGISSPGLRAPKQQTDKDMLRLTATADNGSSTALLVRTSTASDTFVDAEDAEAIDNSLTRDIPMVYSIAGNTAAQINQFCSERMIPVGVINGTTESTPVKVTGTDTFGGTVSVYDAMLNTTTPLQEGDNITMLNNVSGRYYISLGEATSIDNTASTSISITSPSVGVLQIVSSPSTPLTEVKVYLPNGALVASSTSLNKSTVTLNVPSSMYIVHAVTCDEQRVVKIITK